MKRELAILEKLEKDVNLKQLQIKSLLTITQAINDNVSAEGLFNMYKSFLSWEMGVETMALYVSKDKTWECATNVNTTEDMSSIEAGKILLNYTRLHTIKNEDHRTLQQFDIIIPVYHKEQPIAYALIGGIKEQEDLYSKIQFITTITNIIAVAIENKRLFNKQIEQERLKREMELASNVQKMLIPDELPKGKGYELASIYKPHFTVGGDYYDCIEFGEDRFAFCIADISGKGVGAAILMANFQAILQGLLYRGINEENNLEKLVRDLNAAVYKITKADKFITFFIVEMDLKRKQIQYVNAGHFPPFMIMADEIIRLDQGCTILGCFDELPPFEIGKLDITNEAILMAFTDGLIDLQNDKGEYFDETNIGPFMKLNTSKNAQDFNDSLLQRLDEFKQQQDFPDDIAVITCKIYQNGSEN